MHVDIKGNRVRVNQFVGRFELEPIHVPDEETEPFIFVIDIMKKTEDGNDVFPLVYRREVFSIIPTFGKDTKEVNADILVVDTMRDWESIIGYSADNVLDEVLKELRTIFDPE